MSYEPRSRRVLQERMAYLHEGTDNAEGREAQVFEGACFRGRIQEWIQEEWNVSCRTCWTSIGEVGEKYGRLTIKE